MTVLAILLAVSVTVHGPVPVAGIMEANSHNDVEVAIDALAHGYLALNVHGLAKVADAVLFFLPVLFAVVVFIVRVQDVTAPDLIDLETIEWVPAFDVVVVCKAGRRPNAAWSNQEEEQGREEDNLPAVGRRHFSHSFCLQKRSFSKYGCL